ncbi:hypothetical protein Tco_1307289 [Tanacetum coccineum]
MVDAHLGIRITAQAENERYIYLIEKSVKDIINNKVKTQLPQILPKAVSDFATPVIKSTIIFDEHKELYKALVNSYNVYKDLFLVYSKVVSLKRVRKDKDKDEDSPAGSDQGMKRRKTTKDFESTRSQPKSSGKSAQAEEKIHIVYNTEVQQNQGEDMGNTDDQPNVEAALKHEWFKKPKRPPTPDSDWNIGKSVDFRPPQT